MYVFVIAGQAEVNNFALETRDGYGVSGIDRLTLKATQNAHVLLMEVPMLMGA